ncbi:uncharacterized protein DUF4091 [Scopulibacillus darangshiensis]|uniref:Uncharacterized protein DUF4091 n=1 Tax=Scopulibacillus darangshiensis TaxID=442528 RepID=A0A4R2P5Y0_9BACL|nr:DUF4091 domain-containing protein [Scopulibacillus darangshiensis]TCP29618.1 uncharacterized protein DUF4091 [Scopulibacillus darangshiensis]
MCTTILPNQGEAEKNIKPGPGFDFTVVDDISHSTKLTVERALPKKGLNTWIPSGNFEGSSLIKVPRFPSDISGDIKDRDLKLSTVRNEQVSAQLAVASTKGIIDLRTSVCDLKSENGDKISSKNVHVRYVGYVPVAESINGAPIHSVAGSGVSGDRHPDVVADPLINAAKIDVADHRAQPIWFTFNIPKSAKPGVYHGEVLLASGNDETITYNLTVDVKNAIMPDSKDYKFHLDVWMNPNAIATAYHVKPWQSEKFWHLIEVYFKDLASSGQKTITTPIIQNPWLVGWNNWQPQTATGYDSMVKWKHDGENWDFDYSIFDRYVKTGLKAGVGPYITAYSLLVFRGPQRITYLDERTGKMIEKRTEVGSQFWTEAWTAFLQDFSAHLKKKGWLDKTYLAFDERPADIVSQVIDLIKNAAPEFLDQTQMAGTQDVGLYAQNLSLGISDLTQVSGEWIDERHQKGKETTFYMWAGDTHPNTLTFSPSVESRMIGWIAAKWHLDGFLHWAYNDWTNDVFKEPVYAFTQGDEYFIYPDKNGPMSSIRWELLKEGIEDYELLQMVKEKDPNSENLKEALGLATRQWDGRKKDVNDLVQARHLIMEEL